MEKATEPNKTKKLWIAVRKKPHSYADHHLCSHAYENKRDLVVGEDAKWQKIQIEIEV